MSDFREALDRMQQDPSRYARECLAEAMETQRRRERRGLCWRGIKTALGLGPRASTRYRREGRDAS